MLVFGLSLALVVLMGGSAYLRFVRGYLYLAALAAVAGLFCSLAVGILDSNQWLIGIDAVGLAAWAVFWWWKGGNKGRRRASRELGDESRQLRDGLVRQMRQRRVTWPGWSPSR